MDGSFNSNYNNSDNFYNKHQNTKNIIPYIHAYFFSNNELKTLFFTIFKTQIKKT